MLYQHKKIDYTIPSGHEGGPGVAKQITPYVGTPYINMTAAQWAAVQQAIGAKIGDTWTLGGGAGALGGNTFQFVKAGAGLTLGQVVSAGTPTSTTTHNPGGESTIYAVVTHYNSVAAGANSDVDNWIWYTTALATLPQLRRIKANDASATCTFTVSQTDYLRPNSPRDADAFDTVCADNDTCIVIRPYNVIVCTASLSPVGIALGTVTSGQYTIIQIAGLASVAVDADGVNQGLTVNVPAATTAAGCIFGTNGAAFLRGGASLILPQMTTTKASGFIPAYVNFTRQ